MSASSPAPTEGAHVPTSPTLVPVAASTSLTGVLTGPRQQARVTGAGSRAGYLVTESGTALALATPSAAVPSCALVLVCGLTPADVLHVHREVLVGGGEVRTATHRLVVRRWWTPARITPGSRSRQAAAVLCGLLGADTPLPDQVLRARAAGDVASAHLVGGRPLAAVTALTGVLGLGPGLTPSGDDVATGVLLGGLALSVPGTARVAAALADAAGTRTNAVSAALLAEAAAGRSASVVVRAVDALLGQAPAEACMRALLCLGHHSGADLASGLLAISEAVGRCDPVGRAAPRGLVGAESRA